MSSFPSSQPLLEVHDLTMIYPNGSGGLRALDKVCFEVQDKEFVCLVGPSGSGKTTLLRLIAGLTSPTSGEVRMGGTLVERQPRKIGFVFQEISLMPWRTVLENIGLPLELEGRPAEELDRRARALMDLVGLEGFAASYPKALSGGMGQRVAIARALVHNPDLLLLDEPFGALDALTRERMAFELMRIWQARVATVLMVTHSIPEALLLADRVLVLGARPGKIKLDVEIPLGRPRTQDMTYSPEFGELASRIRSSIESDA